MRQALFPNPEALASLCQRHCIRQLSLFGSTLRGGARPDSDIDLLVEFESQAKPGLIALAGIELDTIKPTRLFHDSGRNPPLRAPVAPADPMVRIAVALERIADALGELAIPPGFRKHGAGS